MQHRRLVSSHFWRFVNRGCYFQNTSSPVSLGVTAGSQFFAPIFAASRVAGWTARVFEYMQNNRLFRPRSLYTGDFNKSYTPIEKR
jgi:citrate synthase